MNAYDASILVAGLLLVLIGALKGVARIAVSIASLVAGFLLASWFGGVVGSLLSSVTTSERAQRLAGFALVFVLTIVAGTFVGWLLVKALETAKLRWIDRLAGAAAGFVATILLFAALSVPLAAYLPPDSSLLRESRFAPIVVRLGAKIDAAVPESVRSRFRAGLSRLEREWRARR